MVEIGPGFSTKVGFGLADLEFRGTVILVEPCAPASSYAARGYRQLLPRAAVHTRRTPIPDAAGLADLPVDLLLANHILDDLLLNAYLPPGTGDRIFAGMRPGLGCSAGFVQTWQQILAVSASVDRMVDRVVDDLVSYIDAVRPDRLLMNHYPSWQHRRSGLDGIHEIGLHMMRRLGRRLEPVRPTTTHVHHVDRMAISWLISNGCRA